MKKELFVSTINALKSQYQEDKRRGELIKDLFCRNIDEDIFVEFHRELSHKVLEILQDSFINEFEHGFCPVEYYCFELNFGTITGNLTIKGNKVELNSSTDLYEFINKYCKFKN